jgi:hypothetical protein
VKRELSDERLQDYLDGRLSETERSEIEARLADDRELARRVEAWREIGRALREDAGEPSSEFYARTRERFERSVRRRPPWGFRILSWEAAGLAAAVALAGVLFAPELMREREPGRAPLRTAPREADAILEDRPSPAEPLRAKEKRESDDGGKARASTEVEGVSGERVMRSAPSAGPADESKSLEDRRAPEPAWAPEPQEAAGAPAEEEPVKDDHLYAAQATAPRRGDARAEADAELAEKRQRMPVRDKKGRPSGKEAEATDAYAPVPAPESLAGAAPRALEVPVVDLPAGVSIADGLQIVDDPVDRAAWLDGPAGSALARLGAGDGERRLVLVGRAGGADCSSLTVRRAETGYRVHLGQAGASAGCALLLPRDALAVVLEPAPKRHEP